MKLVRNVLLILVVSTSLVAGAKHCIQVTAVHKYKEGEIRSSILNIIENYDKARIDKRGRRHVLRVGDYKDATSAKKDLIKIRREYRDAFIRRCDYDPASAVYPPFEDSDDVVENNESNELEIVEVKQTTIVNNRPDFQEESVLEEIEEESNLAESALPAKVQKSFNYNKQEKYNYEFWQECQKCFAPITQEANNDYVEVEEVQDESESYRDEFQEESILKEPTVEDELVEEIDEKESVEIEKRDTEEESSGFFSSLFSIFSFDDETDEEVEIEEAEENFDYLESDAIFQESEKIENSSNKSDEDNAVVMEDVQVVEESYYGN